MEFKQIIDSITSIIFVGISVGFDFTNSAAKDAFLNECMVTFKNKKGAELSGFAKDLLDEFDRKKERICDLGVIDEHFSFSEHYLREPVREWQPCICIISKGAEQQEFRILDEYGKYTKTASTT